jgi:hypothetical protein
VQRARDSARRFAVAARVGRIERARGAARDPVTKDGRVPSLSERARRQREDKLDALGALHDREADIARRGGRS